MVACHLAVVDSFAYMTRHPFTARSVWGWVGRKKGEPLGQMTYNRSALTNIFPYKTCDQCPDFRDIIKWRRSRTRIGYS